MASEYNESFHNNPVSYQITSESEEELIDLDKVLPLKKDSNWLLESNNNSSDFHASFNELHFSNPLIKDFIESIYITGKSKQVLNHLMYWNDRMTISCDNYSSLCKNNTPNIAFKENHKKRHSLALTTPILNENSYVNDSESLTDSLNSIESIQNIDISNGNVCDHINQMCTRMTQSSITEYNGQSYVPHVSENLPTVKNVSNSQNVLSRTYDKEDLEILKKTQLSQSVLVPHISGSNIDHYSEIESRDKIPKPQNSVVKRNSSIPCKNSSVKRLFPTANSNQLSVNEPGPKPRPNSMYQIDKLSKNTIDRCLKMSQQKSFKFNPKLLLKTHENVFDTDVLTPINSPRNIKQFSVNKQSRLKSPVYKSFIR